ncbi:GNAT family N-acetyltransferase [Pontibacter saemangeumensis]|uniref:GNAT family N-acetyltransferase n=1 Tax=Pontibacter saemangeumensis TaxID=1084525 RepID=A0ABP8LAB0_9BACT
MAAQALDCRRVTPTGIPEVAALQQLYEEAFPVYERRDYAQLLQLLDQPAMFFYAAMQDKLFVGFYIYWQLQGFCFLEHIAILPALQGQGYGRQLMQRIMLETGAKLVLEVERPTNELSRRRISFYQNLGFALHAEHDYYQPPYQPGRQPVPLYLMAAPPLADPAEIAHVSSHIRQAVYERFYE